MLDINFITENADLVKEVAKNKRVEVDINRLLELNEKRRELLTSLDEKEAERNELAKEISKLNGPPSKELAEKGSSLKEVAQELKNLLEPVLEEYSSILLSVPNMPTGDTPVGADESDNVVLRTVGEVPSYTYTPKEHWELGKDLGLIDSETAAEVSGSRFSYLKSELVMLQMALIQHAMNLLTNSDELSDIIEDNSLEVSDKPFVPVLPPAMVKRDVMKKMARLEPEDERYNLESDDLFLVGSAEHTLGPMHMNTVLSEKELPVRYVGYSPSFRREAGSYGKDVKGILRLHQFDKIEIESFTSADDSLAEQEFIVAIQEHLMQSLELPYQVVLKCTGDMGSPDARAIDIETWMPGQGKYRETHTSDLMTDYQSRRLKTKYKDSEGGSSYVHMNDATVFAMGRTLIAIMENYQQEDGSIKVPEALKRYVSFTEIKK